jgi:hypothetical protein
MITEPSRKRGWKSAFVIRVTAKHANDKVEKVRAAGEKYFIKI